MLLPDFYLPSRPNLSITFDQPTIEVAMRFNLVGEEEEERQTTAYLKVLQNPPGQSDPSTWTGEDRRTALWWIYTGSNDVPVETFIYTCKHCGEEHHYDCNMNSLADHIVLLEREPVTDPVMISSNGEEYFWEFRPLDGWALEMLEMRRENLPDPDDKENYEIALVNLRLWEFAYQSRNHYDILGTREEQSERAFIAIKSMVLDREFIKLAAHILKMQQSFEHGIPVSIDKGESRLRTPAHPCPVMKKKEPTSEKETHLWVPFRPSFFIPQLGLERLSKLSIQPGFIWGYSRGRYQKAN